jgi:hypothetical protein
MNTISKKQIYCTPQIECVKLDNEISLVLVSVDPNDPYGSSNSETPEYFNNNPLKDNIG